MQVSAVAEAGAESLKESAAEEARNAGREILSTKTLRFLDSCLPQRMFSLASSRPI
jgi:hypothetical protein